jgi:hypothetical protein
MIKSFKNTRIHTAERALANSYTSLSPNLQLFPAAKKPLAQKPRKKPCGSANVRA